jgi:hypothetical protein
MLEKNIYSGLYQHFIEYNILAKHQYGFRSNSSTEMAIYKLRNEISEALNNWKIAGGILCDLPKAFDCVNHRILRSKFEFYGINGSSLKSIKLHFQDINQKVQISTQNCNNFQEWRKISQGVPEGSILGPLLFLIYINEVPI